MRLAPSECGMRNAELGDAARRLSSVTVGSRKPEVAPETDDLPLDETETAVLRAVLYGEDAAAAAKAGGRMLSVAVDAINDKLFDAFGDTVIYGDGTGPAVYEDYEEELKERIGT